MKTEKENGSKGPDRWSLSANYDLHLNGRFFQKIKKILLFGAIHIKFILIDTVHEIFKLSKTLLNEILE